MVVFVLISTFSFFALLVLGIRVLQERGGTPTMLFGLYALAASFVSLIELMLRLAESPGRAQLWAHAAFLWPIAPALFLHFVLVASLRRSRLRTLFVILDYIGAAVMGTLYAFYVQSGNALEWRYGWALTSPMVSEWPWGISTIIATAYVLISFSLLLARALRPGGELAQQEQRWILLAYAVRFVFGISVHGVATQAGVTIPEMNSLAYGVFAILIYLGISRAHLLSLSPQRTVGKILTTMDELLFLTTKDYTIVTANRAAGIMLGKGSGKLRGLSFYRTMGIPEGTAVPAELQIRDANGEDRSLHILQSDPNAPISDIARAFADQAGARVTTETSVDEGRCTVTVVYVRE